MVIADALLSIKVSALVVGAQSN